MSGDTAPSVLIRCDASPLIGGGHVMRCLTLANTLHGAGWRIRFACVEESTRVVSALARSGFDVIELINPLDADELVEKLDGQFDVIVFDHYGIDASYERALRPLAGTILVIDDLTNRPHDCDVLMDQTFGRNAADYWELVPAGSTILAGAQYALLRPEFAAARKASLARRTKATGVERILISMGLTDIGTITQKVLQAVVEADTSASIDVVLGSGAQSLSAVRELASRHADIAVNVDTADICALMANADLAMGASGTTTWERCCLGLPTIALVMADNQRKIGAELAAVGAVTLFEAHDLEDLSKSIAGLCGDSRRLRTMSLAASEIADGKGVQRIIEYLVAPRSMRTARGQSL